MAEVLVIGGGIAGLTAAYKIRQQGHAVRVLEAQSTAGGKVRTLEKDGFRMEAGPHGFLGSSEYVWRLIRELALEGYTERACAESRHRYVYRDGTLHPLPMSPWSLLTTSLLSWRGKLRLLAEPFIPGGARETDTAWDFFRRRFGEEAAAYIMSPFVSGIYAGDINRLGARAAFAKFWQFERDSGSMIVGAVKYMVEKRRRLAREGHGTKRGLYSMRGGLGRITARLAGVLGEGVMTDITVESVGLKEGRLTVRAGAQQWQADAVVAAVPPGRAARLLAEILPAAAEELRRIPMAPVTLVHWTAPADHRRLPAGFGFLVPRRYDLKVLGTVFASQLFQARAPTGHTLFSSFFGGMLDPAAAFIPDRMFGEVIGREHERILNVSFGQPRILLTLRYEGAIPQLLPDHPEKIASILREVGKLPGLLLAGNYLTGVGIEHAVESGYRAAAACRQMLSAR